LRALLMRAELKPEQRLKMRELALRMGISEAPVREAIMPFAQEGALEIKPRHFVRVRKPGLAENLENRDIGAQRPVLAPIHAYWGKQTLLEGTWQLPKIEIVQ
jgi:DNA-binding GntR family transcriptional regulator